MKKTVLYLFLFIAINSYAQTSESFYPEIGKEYVISGWVKEIHSQSKKGYSSSIVVQFYNGTVLWSSKEFKPSGEIIDGWQRIVGVITIPQELQEDPAMDLELKCKALGGGDCYFDDIRFYPYNGNMKSFVYDEDTQKLMAELDENNYATFYEYDQEGGLIRIKKETERGVFTIQESRSGNQIKTITP